MPRPRMDTRQVAAPLSGTVYPADTDTDAIPRDIADEYLEQLLAAYAGAAPQGPDRERLREQLITGYLPVARNIARRYAGRGEPLDDLEQVGGLGLLKAIERYDPDLGHHFLSFAIPTITGEIRRHFRDRTWSVRVSRRLKDLQGPINAVVAEMSAQLGRAPRPSEIAARLDIPVADVVEAVTAAQAYRPGSLDRSEREESEGFALTDTLGAPDPRFELFTATHSLAPHLAELPERERSILIMRFYQDMTQTQIAEHLGISQMHVSRLLSRTLTRLREAVDAGPAGVE